MGVVVVTCQWVWLLVAVVMVVVVGYELDAVGAVVIVIAIVGVVVDGVDVGGCLLLSHSVLSPKPYS